MVDEKGCVCVGGGVVDRSCLIIAISMVLVVYLSCISSSSSSSISLFLLVLVLLYFGRVLLAVR